MINFFNQIFSMSIDGSVLILVVILVRFIFRKMPKFFRKILWGLAAVRLLMPVVFQSSFSLIPKQLNSAAEVVIDTYSATTHTTAVETGISFIPYFWLAVAIILGVYGLISFIKLKRKIGDAVRDKDNIYLSEKVDSPFVCGFINPKIYLPYSIDENAKEYVLQHETRHIQNADHIFKALGFILVCVYWFNPLVWLAYFLFCKDIELACDESVIEDYTEKERKEYASAILEIGVSKVKLSACPVAFGEVGIKERVLSAVNYKKATKVFIFICVVLCAVVSLCFMTDPKVQAVNKSRLESIEKVEPKVKAENITEPSTTEPVPEKTFGKRSVAEPDIQPKQNSNSKKSETNGSKNSVPIEIQNLAPFEPFTFFPVYGYQDDETEPATERVLSATTSPEMEAIIETWDGSGNAAYINRSSNNG